MKKSFFFTSVLLFMVFSIYSENSQAQLWKKIKNEVKNRAENNVVNRAGSATDKVINSTADEVKKDAKNGNSASEMQAKNSADDNNDSPSTTAEGSVADYKNYDFVPGDKIIFEPDISNEADAELPARYTILKGTAEIQSYEGEKILHLQPDANTAVEPIMSTNHYLPEQFTLEFDAMWENDADYFKYASDFRIGFCKRDNQNYYNGGLYAFVINGASQC
jgi:hypothetical protein